MGLTGDRGSPQSPVAPTAQETQMKKQFRHGCQTCTLIAQTAEADVHLCLPPDGPAQFAIRTDNSRVVWGFLVKVAKPDGSLIGKATAAGLTALARLGLACR